MMILCNRFNKKVYLCIRKHEIGLLACAFLD